MTVGAHNDTEPSHMRAYPEMEPIDCREWHRVVELVQVQIWDRQEKSRQQHMALLSTKEPIRKKDGGILHI